jgi:hypothetical protein
MFLSLKHAILGHISRTFLKLVHIFYDYTIENKMLVANIFMFNLTVT